MIPMIPTKPVDVAEAQTKLDLTVSVFEQQFRERLWNYSGGPRPAYAPTGELFVEHRDGPFATADDAICAWALMAGLLANEAPQGAILYWRVRPEIDRHTRHPRGWATYSRFIISSPPKGCTQ